MFDFFEQIWDIIVFSFYFIIGWEVITLVISYTTWSTTAPAWQVSLINFSWEKIPVVFVLALLFRAFVKSQLRQQEGGVGV